MHPIYFAHGYREREAPVNASFSKLMGRAEFVPSLDPPSDEVNSAKLERHLSYTDALIAVLSNREEGPSRHILYEISMAQRVGKPTLVFIEESLPEGIVPAGNLQSRISMRSYVRETRDLLHALATLRSYLGQEQLPRYRVSSRQRSCILTGTEDLPVGIHQAIEDLLAARGYKIPSNNTANNFIPLPTPTHVDISNATLAICIVDSNSVVAGYALGIVQASAVPAILLARGPYPLLSDIPEEYQRRILFDDDMDMNLQLVGRQIEIFFKDFIEIDTDGKAEKYADELAGGVLLPGHYSSDFRAQIIQEVTMGDRYEANQVGAQGPSAHAHDMTFNQIWQQSKESIDLDSLGSELQLLRTEMQKSAKTAEEFAELGTIANAELEAIRGNGPKSLEFLGKASKWSLAVAEKIGISVASAAIGLALR